MDRITFLEKLFILYGKSLDNKTNTSMLESINQELSQLPYVVNWDKAYKFFETTTDKTYQTMPNLRELKQKLPAFKKSFEGEYTFDNGTGVLLIKDEKLKQRTGHNRYYIQDMWHTTHTIEEICNNYKQKYGDKFISFKYYPEEFSIIGNKVFDHNMELCEVIE